MSHPQIDPSIARRLQDPDAELAILCALLRHPGLAVGPVRASGLVSGDFYHAARADLFDLCLFLAGTPGACTLPNVYISARARGLDSRLGRVELRNLLIDAWDCAYWSRDISRWWPVESYSTDLPYSAAVGIAMCAKVRWLAGRRSAIYRAAEQAQAALDGVPEPDFD